MLDSDDSPPPVGDDDAMLAKLSDVHDIGLWDVAVNIHGLVQKLFEEHLLVLVQVDDFGAVASEQQWADLLIVAIVDELRSMDFVVKLKVGGSVRRYVGFEPHTTPARWLLFAPRQAYLQAAMEELGAARIVPVAEFGACWRTSFTSRSCGGPRSLSCTCCSSPCERSTVGSCGGPRRLRSGR